MPRPDNGLPEDIREHMRLMADIVALAFQTDKTRFVPQATFETPDGQSYTARGTPSGRKRYDEGDVVTVLYRRSSPSDARIKSYRDLFLAAAVMATLSLVVIVSALYLAWLFTQGQA